MATESRFDSKHFNPQAFGYMVGRVPNLKMNEIRKSRALAGNPDIKRLFSTQDGTAYAKIAMRGLIDGDAVNYDGETDIEATSTKTFEQGVVVVGRAKAWTEKDFSYDITGGKDFMQNISEQVAEYKEALDQDTILAILDGVFAMKTGKKNQEFVTKHTHDVTMDKHSGTVDGGVTAASLNTACNKACGANKKKFSLVFMHSDVSTNIENLNLLNYLKYTDKDGVTRDLEIGTWNGRTVVVDDDLPAVEGYFPADADTEGALQVTASETSAGKIKKEEAKPYFGEGDLTEETSYVVPGTRYTTYVLGTGAISFEDVGAKVPYEMARDPKTKGGEDTLYMRQRKVFAPFGISYEKKTQAKLSPTNAELQDGGNWSLVHSGETSEGSRTYINHKAIPIARIFSRG